MKNKTRKLSAAKIESIDKWCDSIDTATEKVQKLSDAEAAGYMEHLNAKKAEGKDVGGWNHIQENKDDYKPWAVKLMHRYFAFKQARSRKGGKGGNGKPKTQKQRLEAAIKAYSKLSKSNKEKFLSIATAK